ncbi:MAG: tetratricopeptide repeat protein [Minicystis sp.]
MRPENTGEADRDTNEAARYARACARDEPSSCFNLATLFEKGSGVGRDVDRAVVLLRRACDLSHGVACFELATRLKYGRGVKEDEESAVRMFLKACEHGSAQGCVSLGLHFEEGRYVAKDQARAAALFTTGCNGGALEECSRLGVHFEQGRGVDKDEARAAALYAKACDGGAAVSCSYLGALVEVGRGVGKDQARALALYRKACDGDDARGCARVYTDACDGGDAASCLRLGHLFDDGRVQQDRARAAELYAKACRGGHAPGCTPQRIKTHFAAILGGLARRQLPTCSDPAPAGAVRTTTNDVRRYAAASALAESDPNVSWQSRDVISPLFTSYDNATGAHLIEYGEQILAAPATLVVDVESVVPPAPRSDTYGPLTIEEGSISARGAFWSGALTVRQVRFDSNRRAVCATRVTVKNSDLQLKLGDDWEAAARRQLLDQIHRNF